MTRQPAASMLARRTSARAKSLLALAFARSRASASISSGGVEEAGVTPRV